MRINAVMVHVVTWILWCTQDSHTLRRALQDPVADLKRFDPPHVPIIRSTAAQREH